jgi:hypothetical protein
VRPPVTGNAGLGGTDDTSLPLAVLLGLATTAIVLGARTLGRRTR